MWGVHESCQVLDSDSAQTADVDVTTNYQAGHHLKREKNCDGKLNAESGSLETLLDTSCTENVFLHISPFLL